MSVASRLAIATDGFRGGFDGDGGGPSGPIIISGLRATLASDAYQAQIEEQSFNAVLRDPMQEGGISGNLVAVLESPSLVATISDNSYIATLGSC